MTSESFLWQLPQQFIAMGQTEFAAGVEIKTNQDSNVVLSRCYLVLSK